MLMADDSITKKFIDMLSKHIKVMANIKKIEKSVKSFAEQYAEINNVSYLLDNVYESKFQELFDAIATNKLLRDSINNNEIALDGIAFMSVTELNPDKYDTIIKKKELIDLKKNNNQGTKAFKCSKCGQSNSRIEEKQTRSGDEPPTIKIICLDCGHIIKI